MYDDDIWERVPVLIHTGVQKSGTSWLTQKYFRYFPDRFSVHTDTETLNALLLTPNQKKFNPEAVRKALRHVAEDAAENGKIVVIVGVFISGMPTDHYAVLPSNLKRTLQVFPKAKFLVTIREQKRILLSVFSELVRGGIVENLEDFLCQPPAGTSFSGVVDFDFYDYNLMYETYTKLIPSVDLAIVPQEWILKEPDKAIAHMADCFGWDIPIPKATLVKERVRPSLSWPALALTRQLNRLTTPGMRWKRSPFIRPVSVAYWADRFTPKSLNARIAKKNNMRVQDLVGEYFSLSNQLVSRKIGIDLGGFEYYQTLSSDP